MKSASEKSKYDIKINEVELIKRNGLTPSKLTLEFTGKSVNSILINTLRRAMLNNVPAYAFPTKNTIIDKNDTIYNNDYMKLRLSQLPIYDTPLELNYIAPKYWKDIEALKDPFKNIEIYINSHNDTQNIVNITTNDIKYLEDGKEITGKYNEKYPILIIKLRPNEQFICKLKASVGVGEMSGIWSAASNVYFTEKEPNDIVMTIESQGQYDEYEILKKACQYIIERASDLKSIITKNYVPTNSEFMNLYIEDETHTMGNIMTDVLQNRKDVKWAGMMKLNQLMKHILIKIEYNEKIDNPNIPILETLDEISNIMKYTLKKLS